MSLAVVEKRPEQRNAGCVGIFFQLFSKKKLLSKKLLPPPTPAKKFVADEKMPMSKFLLIADENRQGFPNLSSGAGSDLDSKMQGPGIVARLMGLESMPAVHNEKPRKALDSKFCGDDGFEHSRLDQGLSVDGSGNARVELRPQKLQKIGGGLLERRQPLQAFHRGLIYGSKKKQHMKLETPVKSPRSLARSSTSRLVQVANKILEPGLQSRSRAKCAITYARLPEDDRDEDGGRSSNLVAVSCKSCGDSVGVNGSLTAEFGSSCSESSGGSLEIKRIHSPDVVSGQRKNSSVSPQPKLKVAEVYKMKEPVVPRRHIKNGSIAVHAELNKEGRAHTPMDNRGYNPMESKKHLGRGEFEKTDMRKSKLRHRQSSPVRDRMVPGTKICSTKQSEKNPNESNKGKSFVAMNKSVNNYARSRSPTKASRGCTVESEKNMTRKSSPANRATESFHTNIIKERSWRNSVASREGNGFIRDQSVNRSCIKSNLRGTDCDSFSASKNNGIVSFTFSSPMRIGSRSTFPEAITRQRKSQDGLKGDACHTKKLMSDAKIGSLSSQKGMAFRADELGTLLEEKIRELSSLDHGGVASADNLQGRSTVSILAELISALTAGTLERQMNGGVDSFCDASIQTEIKLPHNQLINVDGEFQERAQSSTTALCSAGASEQPSPVSILQASFSSDSCSLGTLNECSGSKPQLGLQEMCSSTRSSEMDSDLLDSAASLSTTRLVSKTMTLCKGGILETEPGTVGEAISDAELLFEKISLSGSKGTGRSSLDSFLLDTLESIIDVFCPNFKPGKEGNKLREFLFDCIMECLETKFSHFCRSGFRAWSKLPLLLNGDRLMREVYLELKGWRDLAGEAMDDLVEKSMEGSNLKWIGCDTEAFDTGMEIQSDILQGLIDEMLVDLWQY